MGYWYLHCGSASWYVTAQQFSMLGRCGGRFAPILPLLLRLSFVSTAMGNQAITKGDDPVYNINEAPQPKVGMISS